MMARLKREDCKRTMHDSVFSKWEILIGPEDWADHSLGKDGVERYRIHNLPAASSCPGLYELGLASIPTNDGHRSRSSQKPGTDDIIVVYLGQADNVRIRLQEYGRSGSHLDHGNPINGRKYYESSSLQCGPGLFRDIFAKGYSVLFRWTPINNKKEAEKTESELLCIFDYAWNQRGNGACRHADILSKLNHKASVFSPLKTMQQWKHAIFDKKAGMKIDSSVPLLEEESPSHGLKGFLLPRIIKFSGSQIQLFGNSFHNDQIICGVATGHGSVCRNSPAPGRKRCEDHKGKKISGLSSTSEKNSFCGIILKDGSFCMETPAHGRKRCELHKGRRATADQRNLSHDDKEENGFLCWRKPETMVVAISSDQEVNESIEVSNICGIINGNGCVCRRLPVPGRKRCEEHKGMRKTAKMMSLMGTLQDPKEEDDLPVCGVILSGGLVCMRSPVPGRKRCEAHKGRRVMKTTASAL
ncbi:hypothetical protein AXF42_Ash000679 [Apostasia shenzhenica]|uniref:Protein EFFECTOR OF TRANSCRIPTION 2-like n=1 Tax=Apostasia shenzhenica TaxID=1088818 RepID=A0A2I0AH21_9ASPA|nr:hypothetical protein AXF42_Ash000679 [Apostasia shenzhenica]